MPQRRPNGRLNRTAGGSVVPLSRLAILASVTLISIGCAPGSAPQTSDAAPGPAALHAPVTITAAVSIPIQGFSPITRTGGGNNIFTYFDIYANGLASSDAVGAPTPRIATTLPSLSNGSIRLLSDGTMQTDWTVRPDVTWQDGVALTAHDVAFGYRLDADPTLAFSDRSAVIQISSVVEVDQYTVTINWKQPSYLGNQLGPLILLPLPAHLLETQYETLDNASFTRLPYWTSDFIHAGPFRLDQFEPGQGSTFAAYEGYFLGRPKVDRIIVREIADSNALVASVLSGEVDVTIGAVTASQAAAIESQWQSNGGGRVLLTQGPMQSIFFQFASEYLAQPALLDARIRGALYRALDRRALAELTYGGNLKPGGEALSLMPRSSPLYSYIRDIYTTLANDPAGASQAFAAAGYTRGPDGMLASAAGVHLTLEHWGGEGDQQPIAEANMWQGVGVEVSLSLTPRAQANDQEHVQAFPGTQQSGAGAGIRVTQGFDITTFPTPANGYIGSNHGHYNNPQMNDLLARVRSSLDPAQQGELMRQVAELVSQDWPILPLWFAATYATVDRPVRALDDYSGGYPGGGSGLGGYARSSWLWERTRAE